MIDRQRGKGDKIIRVPWIKVRLLRMIMLSILKMVEHIINILTKIVKTSRESLNANNSTCIMFSIQHIFIILNPKLLGIKS